MSIPFPFGTAGSDTIGSIRYFLLFPMPLYKFVADRIIEADNEEKARDIFCDNSCDFASEAECHQVCDECLRWCSCKHCKQCYP